MDRKLIPIQCFVAVFYVYLIRKGDTITCYKCKAIDQKSCMDSQIEIMCKHGERVCSTLTYTARYDNSNEKYYTKKCVKDIAECKRSCNEIPSHVENCRVSCCMANYCNNGDNANAQTVFQNKRKRSATSHSSYVTNGNIILLVSNILFVVIIVTVT